MVPVCDFPFLDEHSFAALLGLMPMVSAALPSGSANSQLTIIITCYSTRVSRGWVCGLHQLRLSRLVQLWLVLINCLALTQFRLIYAGEYVFGAMAAHAEDWPNTSSPMTHWRPAIAPMQCRGPAVSAGMPCKHRIKFC